MSFVRCGDSCFSGNWIVFFYGLRIYSYRRSNVLNPCLMVI